VHLRSRFCGTIAGRQFARASENTLFAQEFPCRLSTGRVLLSHALDRLEELLELLLAHEITVNLPSKFIRKMRRSQVEECKRHPLSRKAARETKREFRASNEAIEILWSTRQMSFLATRSKPMEMYPACTSVKLICVFSCFCGFEESTT
jgi:hypothetical protein